MTTECDKHIWAKAMQGDGKSLIGVSAEPATSIKKK